MATKRVSRKLVQFATPVLLLAVTAGCTSTSIREPQSTVETFTPSSGSPSRFKFPQASCGDKATESAETWYPVFVNTVDLDSIRSRYCQDAISATRKQTGKPTVQVASFTSYEKASEFAEVGGGEVGIPPSASSDQAFSSTASRQVSSESEPEIPVAEAEAEESSCSSAYPDVCIPPAPPDLDCGDVSESDFQVLPSDPHGFDRDGDGIGCES